MKKLLTCIIAFLLHGLWHPAGAQDYMLTETNENLVVTIRSFGNQQIVFRLFDESADTTEYMINRKDVKAIGFAGDVLKRMKQVTFKPDKLYNMADSSRHPCFIYMTDNPAPLSVFMDSLTPEQVRFRLANATDTTLYFMKRTEVAQITFKEVLLNSSGAESIEAMSDRELQLQAISDAHIHYKGYKAAATISFISGLTVVYGLPFPIISSIVSPAEESLGFPDSRLMQKPAYAESYRKAARHIKSNKVWSNYGYGLGTLVGIYVVALVVITTEFMR
jgi:hypothetical protein